MATLAASLEVSAASRMASLAAFSSRASTATPGLHDGSKATAWGYSRVDASTTLAVHPPVVMIYIYTLGLSLSVQISYYCKPVQYTRTLQHFLFHLVH
jgi:hypothetical protein